MNELIILESIKSVFWLIIFGICIYAFRNEARLFIHSLSGLKIAGATFELRDKKETLRSYILLAEILMDFLSTSDKIEELYKLMHPYQIERLGNFALQYTKEMPEDDWNEALLSNIAHLLMRFNRHEQSINLCNALLVERPNEQVLLNLKGLALMNSRISNNIETAENIFSDLLTRYPEDAVYRFNLALTLSLLKKGDDAIKQMRKVIDDGYWRTNENLLNDICFYYVREHHPDQFNELNDYLNEVMSR